MVDLRSLPGYAGMGIYLYLGSYGLALSRCNSAWHSGRLFFAQQLAALMTNIESFISGSEKLIRIFGNWPSFHDAEVLELNLWRGRGDPDKHISSAPVLTLVFHVWEMTKETSSDGYFISTIHLRRLNFGM
jgi:hypothetical protein